MSTFEPGYFLIKGVDGSKASLYFQFNPEEIVRSRSVDFNDTSGLEDQGPTPVVGSGPSAYAKYTLRAARWMISNINIRLDSSAPPQVGMPNSSYGADLDALRKAVKLLESLVEPKERKNQNQAKDSYPNQAETPIVQLCWGKRIWEGYVTSVNITEKLFTPDLVPKRVEASVNMVVLRVTPSIA